jgi:hypothetical protein
MAWHVPPLAADDELEEHALEHRPSVGHGSAGLADLGIIGSTAAHCSSLKVTSSRSGCLLMPSVARNACQFSNGS